MKGTLVTCPVTKQQIRLMPGSLSLELYDEARKPGGNKGNKQNPSARDKYVEHMRQLEENYQREIK